MYACVFDFFLYVYIYFKPIKPCQPAVRNVYFAVWSQIIVKIQTEEILSNPISCKYARLHYIAFRSCFSDMEILLIRDPFTFHKFGSLINYYYICTVIRRMWSKSIHVHRFYFACPIPVKNWPSTCTSPYMYVYILFLKVCRLAVNRYPCTCYDEPTCRAPTW